MLLQDVSNSILAAPSYDVFPGVAMSQHYDWKGCLSQAQTCLYTRQLSQVSS